uniref:Uncharacterized protein n=1 Tax=Anopheles atroparvus TaxID=41427 RepID=A0AAG5DVD2_ANOAO
AGLCAPGPHSSRQADISNSSSDRYDFKSKAEEKKLVRSS